MFGATKLGKQQPSTYATTTDFCQIFETDMNRLYRLSFLLTGDEPVAEQCFLGGLQMAQEGNPVFKTWAEAWAPRKSMLHVLIKKRKYVGLPRGDIFVQVVMPVVWG
jgi:hypothetical protein